MEDDGGLLILLFSFLLLFHFSFSFLSPHLLWFFSFYYFVVLSSPLFSSLPLLLPLLLSYSTLSIYFSKKIEKAARKTFSTRKGKSTQRSVGNKRNKSRCGRKEENTGDEKGFSTFLCSFTTFSSSPPTPLLIHTSTLHYRSSFLPPSIYFSKKVEKGTATEEIKEIIVGVHEKKKTQGMRRDLGHKGCGR